MECIKSLKAKWNDCQVMEEGVRVACVGNSEATGLAKAQSVSSGTVRNMAGEIGWDQVAQGLECHAEECGLEM